MKQPVRAFPERVQHPRHPMPVVEKDEIRRLLEAKIDALPEALRIAFMLRALEQLDQAFAFDGERCDRIVAKVLQRIASGT
jgi:DNA-directed RNA polymerase specialized sigma24 family protein